MNKKVISYLRLSQGIVTTYLAALTLYSVGVFSFLGSDLSIRLFVALDMIISLPSFLITYLSIAVQPYMVNLPYDIVPEITALFSIAYLVWFVFILECVIRTSDKNKPVDLLSPRLEGGYFISGAFFLFIYLAKIYVTKPDIFSMPNLGIEYVYFNSLFDLFAAIGLFAITVVTHKRVTWETLRNSKVFRFIVLGIVRLWQLSFWLSVLVLCLSMFNVNSNVASFFAIAEAEVRHLMLPLSFVNQSLIVNAIGASGYLVFVAGVISILPLFWIEGLFQFLRSWFDNTAIFQKKGFQKFSVLMWEIFVLLMFSSVFTGFSRNASITQILFETVPWLVCGAISIGYFLWSFKPGDVKPNSK